MGGKRPGCYNISYETKKRMQELRDSGWLVKEIAAECGVSMTSVRNYTVPKYVRMGYKTLSERDKEIVRLRDKKLMGWEDIARQLGICRRAAMDAYKRSKKNEGTC